MHRAGVAQSVEQLIRNEKVACSIHVTGTIPFNKNFSSTQNARLERAFFLLFAPTGTRSPKKAQQGKRKREQAVRNCPYFSQTQKSHTSLGLCGFFVARLLRAAGIAFVCDSKPRTPPSRVLGEVRQLSVA